MNIVIEWNLVKAYHAQFYSHGNDGLSPEGILYCTRGVPKLLKFAG